MQPEPGKNNKPNRLIHEKSPYLLQHAYNPVDWYPWTQEAFDKAKAENKPVFLSIGYSSCHWCHVMEKECFDDQEVAKLLNDSFVCIKVDREERPDLDAAYMAVCQAMGRSCGWPLNVMITPNMNPFFAASFIPKSSRGGMLGLMELVPQVMEIWKMRKAQLEIVGAEIRNRIETLERRIPEKEIKKEVLDSAYENLVADFDVESSGFGTAPKFPRPHTILFLLRYWKRTGNKNALDMAEKTLRAMRLGGIFDQVGFGFHRYSTDSQWLVPHFEKMLYDQALLTLAYTEAYQATRAEKFKLTAKETLDYVLRDLTSAEGAFYSAEDADSEGEEGKFYLWTMDEINKALCSEDLELAIRLFGILPKGNFFDPAVGRQNEQNILHFPKPLDYIASESGITLDDLIFRMGKIRNALFEVRKKRVRPFRDEKVLVDWNGLMIAALAKASIVFGEQKYLQAATKAADFILKNMINDEGILYHRFAEGEKAVEGFLDDYAFFTFGLIELYEASFEEKYLHFASNLTKIMITMFWDVKDGGFYLSSKNTENTMPRMKQVYDGAIPSGNSVGLLNLLRLSRLIGNVDYDHMASKSLKVFAEEVNAAPQAYTFMLAGLDFALGPAYSVVLVGHLQDKETLKMLTAIRRRYITNIVVFLKHPSEAGVGYEMLDGKATVYFCRDQTCMPPTNSVDKMLELLG